MGVRQGISQLRRRLIDRSFNNHIYLSLLSRHHFRTLADPGWIYIAFPIPLTTGCLFQLLDKSSTAWLSITPFLSTVLALVSLALGQHRGWKSLLTLLIILSLLLVASSLLDPETILSRHGKYSFMALGKGILLPTYPNPIPTQ